MKVLDEKAVANEAERIFFSNFKKIKVKPASFWNRLKWKILGEWALICAIHHDNDVLKHITDELHELVEAVERGDYHIEATLDEAGFTPLPKTEEKKGEKE